MVDIHCHILPRIDDGSRSMGESVAMARMAKMCGVDKLAATPHFNGTEDSLEMLPVILSRIRRFRQELKRQDISVEIVPGAEILCLPETLDLARRELLPTLGGSRYLLIEFYFDLPGEDMDRMISGLQEMEYIPVLAHPERYAAVQKQPELVWKWFDQGNIIQLNKGSVMGAFGPDPERCAHSLLQRGTVHVIASDAHGADSRTPDMGRLRAWAEENLGRTYSDVLLRRNPGLILQGRPTLPIN